MPDFGSPVAQGVNIDPNRTVQTLSSILGLQQQQQQLRSQTAQAQMAEINAQQTQAASQVNWKPFLDSGDVDGATKLALAVKPSDPDFATRMGTAIQKSIDVKSAAANLEQQYLAPFKSALGVWAQGDGDIVDLGKQFDAQVASVPKSAQPHVRELANQVLDGLGLPHVMDGAPTTSADQKRSALALSRSALGAEASKPVVGTAISKQGALVGTSQSPISGELTQAPGGMAPGLAPTQTLPYQGALAATTAAASARATGVATIDTQRASQVSSSIQPSMAAIGLTQQIDSLADQIHSGKFADEISRGAAALGLQNETYARQLLKKDLGQVQARAITNAPTDESRGTILSGYPEATSDPQTIHTAMDYIRGSFRQNLARGKLLNSYQQSKPDLTGFQHADDALTGTMDPLMTEYQSLKTPQERIGFYKRNFQTAEEAHAFKNKVQGVGHILGENGTGP